ncbi:hypothetical protein FHG87_021832 [Trinorchestia longiramus]|nr:hypothetical protein FHG87_021832 [Trinorchestia longiramus]
MEDQLSTAFNINKMFPTWIFAAILAVAVALTAASPRPGYGHHGHVSYGHQIQHGHHHGGFGHGGHGGYGHGGHGGFGLGGNGKSFVFFQQHFNHGHHGYH